jgi:two-component system phosphate regulon response regulator PhoB
MCKRVNHTDREKRTMSESKGRVLIVEDDEDIAALLKYTFTEDGYAVSCATSGEQALRFLREQPPTLALLDIMLPGPDGLELLRHIRREPELKGTAVIMLTAKGEEVDRIVGFELGADDYVVKPFSPRELLLRAKSVLNPTAGQPQELPQRLECHGIILDLDTHECIYAGQKVALTTTEFKLLAEMMRRPGKALSREHLLNAVWGYSFEGYARTVDTHVRRLRRKLDAAAACIETVRGVGYRIKN